MMTMVHKPLKSSNFNPNHNLSLAPGHSSCWLEEWTGPRYFQTAERSVGKILADIMDNRETFNMTSEMNTVAQEHFTGSGCGIRITAYY